MERLDKIISSQRADGRKEVQKLIKSGAVLVNGKICKKPDTKVDPGKDEIVVDGQALNYSKHIYIMMNKPAGVVSATEDRQFKTVIDIIPEDKGRKTVMDLMPKNTARLFPVGRLDRDTEGLLLITDDGDFAHSITSPKKHVDKKYVAKLDGEITEDTVKAFSDGIEFSDGTKCRSAVLECDENDKKTGIVTICEGKYHQVKKMFLCCGLKVVHLQRISIGGLYLDSNLHIGECKLLTDLDKKSVFIGNIH
jgi:16S rRNA pseudouridine516 synthase